MTKEISLYLSVFFIVFIGKCIAITYPILSVLWLHYLVLQRVISFEWNSEQNNKISGFSECAAKFVNAQLKCTYIAYKLFTVYNQGYEFPNSIWRTRETRCFQ